MSDAQKPEKSATQDLAERVVDAHRGGEELTPFQDEINGLSNEEQLQFAKDLNSQAISTNTYADGAKRLSADARVDSTTGNLVDLELVDVSYTQSPDGKATVRHRTAKDIFTPGEAGEAYDKHQEIEALARPYKDLFYMMNERDHSDPFRGFDRREDRARGGDWNYKVAANYLSEQFKDHPDKDAVMAAFQTVKDPLGEGKYKSVDSLSSVLSYPETDLSTTSPEFQKTYQGIAKVLTEHREFEQRLRRERESYRASTPRGDGLTPSDE